MKNITLSLVAFLCLFVAACSDEEGIKAEKFNAGDFNIYLIEAATKHPNSCQINDTTIVLKEVPLLTFDDFKYYNSNTYTFKLTNEGAKAFDNLSFPVQGIPFGVFVRNELIYTGYFWPAYSSLACDAITIEPSQIKEKKELKVQMGHPDVFDSYIPSDKRNDPAIIEVFKRAGKLITR